VCEIVGQGPIPVAIASRLLDDAFIKVLLVDGTDVLAVSHPGRTIPERLRTAVARLGEPGGAGRTAELILEVAEGPA
jgi:hypothetical protein